MKKFLALLLSVLMLLTMTAAFAEEGETLTAEGAFTKKYTGALPIGDELKFVPIFVMNETTGEVASDTYGNPGFLTSDIPLKVEADEDGVYQLKFTAVEVPNAEYGKYLYKIVEQPVSTVTPLPEDAADQNANPYVEYDTGALYVAVIYTKDDLRVTLVTPPGTQDRTTSVLPEDAPDNKDDQFVNDYKVGEFDVTKTIKGNAANLDDTFVVEVGYTAVTDLNNLAITYTSSAEGATAQAVGFTSLVKGTRQTQQITIGNGETISFANVPQGVEIDIVELKQSGKSDLNGYTATYPDGQEITVDETSQTLSIVNNREAEVPTGIELDSIPYIVLLAVAVLGAVGFIVKRRMIAADED